MAPDWFDAWAFQHATIFGFSDGELTTILSWRERFLTAGYLRAELDEATKWLASNPQQVAANGMAYLGKMTAHLAALQTRIHDQRAVEYQTGAAQKESELGTCVLCSGTGWVVVPHLGGILAGEWMPQKIARAAASYYTQSVLCSCALGNWLAPKMEFKTIAGKVMNAMTLESYQRKNPRWKIQLEKRRQRQWKLARLREEIDNTVRSRRERDAEDRLEHVFDALMARHGIVRGEDGYEVRKDNLNGRKNQTR